MVTGLDLALLAVGALVLVGLYRVLKTARSLFVNAVVGLVVLVLADFASVGVVITPIVVLVVALGGLPGAVIVLLLARLNLLFEPLLVALPV